MIAAVWTVYGGLVSIIPGEDIFRGMQTRLLFIPVIGTLIVWLWGVVDAYRSPVP